LQFVTPEQNIGINSASLACIDMANSW